MFLKIPLAGEWITRSFPKPLITPGIPVFGIALPSLMILPSLCPRIVSITTSTSSPAVNPGPKAIVIGAISLVVPRFFFARMASTTAIGCNCLIISPFGSIINAGFPAFMICSASLISCARWQVISSTCHFSS